MTKYNSQRPFSSELGGFIDNFFNSSIGDLIGRDFANGSPAVNVTESPTAYRIDVAAPGLQKADFKVHIEKDILTISAKKEPITEEKKDDTYKRREFNYGTFQRQFSLSKEIDKDSIQATYKNGILAVTLSKSAVAEDNNKTIEIN